MPAGSARRQPSTPEHEQLLVWVERVAMFFRDQYNLPPITGRILGWLMVCDPPEQSGAQIAAAIGASRASITTNMRLLVGSDLVTRLTRPGERTTYYVVGDDAWETVIRRRIDQMMTFAQITAEAIELLGRTGSRADRVRAAHEGFEWFAEVLRAAAPIPKPKGRRR